MREYKFDSVQAFNKELNAAKRENQNYETVSAEYEKTCFFSAFVCSITDFLSAATPFCCGCSV